jgi:hypothetical protein
MPTPNLIPTWITSWEAFIKAHERMILIGVAAGLLGAGVYVINSRVHEYFDNKHVEAQQIINGQIATQEQKTQALETQIAQMQTQYTALTQTLTAAIAAQKQVVVVQQKKDDAMPPTELAQRWSDLIKAPVGSIAPQPNGTLAVSTDASHTTVDALETIPELKFEAQSLNTQLSACNTLSATLTQDVAEQKTLVAEEKKGRAADAVVAKDKERKSFWKGTKVGAAVATVAIIAIKIALIVK